MEAEFLEYKATCECPTPGIPSSGKGMICTGLLAPSMRVDERGSPLEGARERNAGLVMAKLILGSNGKMRNKMR